ncbi:MAG TPA: 3-methyl-2-oxobutanoate hydroxymethyltransferase [Gemmatimonadaceae bacterium]|nr:3-methyl-2-oxobutanoate hydroxymethyltransferase [Gemmatimonadaceae bacterium]
MTHSAAGASALPTLAALQRAGQPIVMLTAYDFPSGRVAEEAGVDVVLVGDSAAMTVLGYTTTRDISVDELLVLTRAVRRAVTSIPLVGDLPFGSYEQSDASAVATARRFVEEAGCDAVKLEGADGMLSRATAIIAAGIPVIGHVGLLPQSVTSPEGYRAKGRDAEQALEIITGAEQLEAAGCAALVVEAVPSEIGALIAERVRIPVIGIGAGGATGGQVLVYHDLLGLGEGRTARFVRRYAEGRELLVDAVRRWADDVRAHRFPSVEEGYGMPAEEAEALRKKLG